MPSLYIEHQKVPDSDREQQLHRGSEEETDDNRYLAQRERTYLAVDAAVHD